ncbi:hypothetical protein [Bacillus sp. FSL R12-0069]|uniref:hypothetical protein n=1 Tax=Bacillus sp. FSL R12-0069 TaxID=2975342 RepID=UPI0030FBEFCC
MNIKPIETIYKGYRFRSRLEARWAVFFDTLGIEWKYENEGYDLGELGWYLPDFEIKFDFGYGQEYWFVEVKHTNDGEAFEKANYLDIHCQEPFTGVLRFCELEYAEVNKSWCTETMNQSNYLSCRLGVSHEEFNKAITKARQARFEHGETPLCKY